MSFLDDLGKKLTSEDVAKSLTSTAQSKAKEPAQYEEIKEREKTDKVAQKINGEKLYKSSPLSVEMTENVSVGVNNVAVGQFGNAVSGSPKNNKQEPVGQVVFSIGGLNGEWAAGLASNGKDAHGAGVKYQEGNTTLELGASKTPEGDNVGLSFMKRF